MSNLNRDGLSELPYGVVLRSSNVSARVGEVRRWAGAGGPVREAQSAALPEQLEADNVPPDAAQILGTLAQEAGMRPVLTLPLSDLAVPSRPGGRDRSAAAVPYVEMQVPAPRDNEGQVVLDIDDTGLARWVVSESAACGDGTDRADTIQTFRIPVEQIGFPADQPERGLIGFGFKKTLHVLRFPIERIAGRAAKFAVGKWENRYRPYQLRLTSPETFLDPTASQPVRLTELDGEPFLVFVHGTFSRGHVSFHGLGHDQQFLRDLHQRYHNRVLVFDHPTVHVDPVDNARWLLKQLPADRQLTFDLVTHSRGGLVARQIGQQQVARDVGRPVPAVRTLIHVATPNAGTVLASKQRLGDLLSVFTNLLTLFPDELVSSTVEVVLEVVKQCATGVLAGLDGLAAMDPASPALSNLNSCAVPAMGKVHAVASDFVPAEGAGPAIRALDLLVDRLFAAGNDLVVPTEGVHRAGSYVVQDPLVIPSPSAVAHNDFFQHKQVRTQLAQWLS